MLAIGVDGGVRAWRCTPPGRLSERIVVVLLVVLIISIAGGLGILIGGARPAEPLHFVYAIVVLGVLPIAETLSRKSSPRRRGIATLLGALVAVIVLARLFATG